MGKYHPVQEWLGVFLLCTLGLTVSLVAGERVGWIGYVVGFPVGIVAPIVAVWSIAWASEYVRRGGPRFPPCHAGTCKGRRRPSLRGHDRGDYERVMVGDDSVLRCKCGRDYVTREAGRRFLERLPDGTLTPYMAHKNFRGWFADTEEGE